MSPEKILLYGLSAACAGLCLSAPSVARAGDAAPREIRIVVVGTPAEQSWVEHALDPNDATHHASVSRAASFSERDVLAPHAVDEAALGCWIDLRDPLRARIYFRAKSGDRFLLRDLELSGRLDELDREALSEVIGTSSSALLEDEHAGLSRAETVELMASRREPSAAVPGPTPVRQKPPAQPPSARTFFGAGLAYGGQAFSYELPIRHGPALWLSLGRQSAHWFAAVWSEGDYYLPLTAHRSDASVRLEALVVAGGVELGTRLAGAGAPRVLSLRLGGGAELTHLSPEPGYSNVALALSEPRWSELGMLTGSAGAALELGASAALGVRARVDLLPSVARFDVLAPGGRETLVLPLHVRPGVALELSTR